MKNAYSLAVLSMVLASQAHGTVFTLDDTARGWVTSTTNDGTVAGNNYLAGYCGPPNCNTTIGEHRNFFTFNIPVLDGPIVSAVLNLNSGSVVFTDSPSATYQITSLSTIFTFSAIGTGTVFGSRSYSTADAGTVQSIALNAAGIGAIASNTSFGVGGRITTLLASPVNEFLFGTTDVTSTACGGPCLTQLQITTIAATPEPGAMVLFGSGLAVFGFGLRRRFRLTT